MPILLILKNLKMFLKPALVISLVVAAGYFGKQCHSYVFEQGYDSAVLSYNEQIVAVREEERLNYNKQLSNFKEDLEKQHKQELKRVESEKQIDTKVEYVTRVIKEKEYVQAECNTVHPDIIGMFNEAITSVNR